LIESAIAPVMSSGHRRLHRQVAVGEARHLVEERQDRILVAAVTLGLEARDAAHPGLRGPAEDRAGKAKDRDRDRDQRRRRAGQARGLGRGLRLERLRQPVGRVPRSLAASCAVASCPAELERAWSCFS
jgi:hypothetical protein